MAQEQGFASDNLCVLMKRETSSVALTNDAKWFSSLMSQDEIPHFVFYGSMLGLCRDGRMIDGDDDVDFLVDDRYYDQTLSLLSRNGCRPRNLMRSVFSYFTARGGSQIDLYFYKNAENSLIEKWNFCGSELKEIHIPKHLVLPVADVDGIKCPNDMKSCCEYLYGTLWRTRLEKNSDYHISVVDGKPVVEYRNGYSIKDWDLIYEQDEIPEEHSSFCDWALSRMTDGSVADIACGNGRDSVYLSGYKEVVATDSANVPNPLYPYTISDCENIPNGVSNIYCRMFLHAINRDKQNSFLKACYDSLPVGGVFLAEFRSKDDELFGLGKRLSDNEFIYGHYRRFIDEEEVRLDLFNSGFTIKEIVKGRFSPMGGKNPSFIRVWCEK